MGLRVLSELLPVGSEKNEPTNEFEKLLNDVECMTCYNLQGNGGTFAPELTHEGSKLKGRGSRFCRDSGYYPPIDTTDAENLISLLKRLKQQLILLAEEFL